MTHGPPAILTVDDDPSVSRAIARDLRRRYGENYRIIRASAAAEALDALKEIKLRGGRVAIMLADYRMPQMNGIEFLEQAVLLSGTISLTRMVGQDSVETVRTEQRGVYMGATQAYLREDGIERKYMASMRALDDSEFFVMEAADFGHMMREWFPTAIHLLEGLTLGMRNSQAAIGERQRLAALGALSAGLMHELNNPRPPRPPGPPVRCASGSPACGTSSACSPTARCHRLSSTRWSNCRKR